jgi:hypothetical protein
MGYRSDVVICIFGQRKAMEAFVHSTTLIGTFAKALKNFELTQSGDMLFWTAWIESWKWYEDDPVIQNIMALWDRAEEWRTEEDETADEGQSLSGAFVRHGENTDDIKEHYFGEDNPFDVVYTARSIETGIPTEVYKPNEP